MNAQPDRESHTLDDHTSLWFTQVAHDYYMFFRKGFRISFQINVSPLGTYPILLDISCAVYRMHSEKSSSFSPIISLSVPEMLHAAKGSPDSEKIEAPKQNASHAAAVKHAAPLACRLSRTWQRQNGSFASIDGPLKNNQPFVAILAMADSTLP